MYYIKYIIIFYIVIVIGLFCIVVVGKLYQRRFKMVRSNVPLERHFKTLLVSGH
jgi:hypothetical protein